jgi:hypothetical protein
MKSKHIIWCLIGFIVFVHAHYFNSWINYYEAPLGTKNVVTKMNLKSNSEPFIYTGKTAGISPAECDSIKEFTADSTRKINVKPSINGVIVDE